MRRQSAAAVAVVRGVWMITFAVRRQSAIPFDGKQDWSSIAVGYFTTKDALSACSQIRNPLRQINPRPAYCESTLISFEDDLVAIRQ